MPSRILCVAEKPSIAKAVANHLGGGRVNTRSIPNNQFVKNYDFDFAFGPPWGHCNVTMTSVLGHMHAQDFEDRYRSWKSCSPIELFEAPIIIKIEKDKLPIAKNIEAQAAHARALFIWTDCDREGENIGDEIAGIARKSKPSLEVKRAKFSNIERAHILAAAHNPIDLDERQVNAVAARLELDLRIGAAFTRFQTLSLQNLGPQLNDLILSYGSCQFPTLGFVVDRYFRVRNFIPEPFWSMKLIHRRENINVSFNWQRVRLFDRMTVTILFERSLSAKTAKISKVLKKPTSKWRPLPLTTVELQKLGTRFLSMDSHSVMKVAEDLYTKGFISYPRTETDQFDKDMNLKKLLEKQTNDRRWGTFAEGLINGGFRFPRSGRNNDHAHPPIHPVAHVEPESLASDQRKVYELVTRRFLACCSEDAKGESTTIEAEFGDEIFSATGLIVLQRNYLDVYPYEKWESNQELPKFVVGERFQPTQAMIHQGETTAPGYLTEPELITLMDANGIGTDATIAQHIAKIKDRKYVSTQPKSSTSRTNDENINDQSEYSQQYAGTGRGRGRSQGAVRGRGRGRGGGQESSVRGQSGARSSGNIQEFIPTTLGVALVEGYDNIGFETSLSKPFLRKEMEIEMKEICAGRKSRHEVVRQSLHHYREVFEQASERVDVLKAACRQYVIS